MTVKATVLTYAVTSPLSNLTTVVSVGPAKLWGVYVNAALSAHTVSINNGTTARFTIPASAAAGTHYKFDGVLFEESLKALVNVAGSGSVTIQYSN